MDPRTEKMLAERAERAAVAPAPKRRPISATKLVAGAVVAALLVAYHFIVTVPAQRADREQIAARAAQTIKTETVSNHVAVSDCLTRVKTDADARWNAACKARRQGADCPLPERQAEAFERAESDARNACLIGQ